MVQVLLKLSLSLFLKFGFNMVIKLGYLIFKNTLFLSLWPFNTISCACLCMPVVYLSTGKMKFSFLLRFLIWIRKEMNSFIKKTKFFYHLYKHSTILLFKSFPFFNIRNYSLNKVISWFYTFRNLKKNLYIGIYFFYTLYVHLV